MDTIRIRTKRQDDHTLIRMLISHPMETGLRKDESSGRLIPPQFIQELTVKHNEQIITSCTMGWGIAKDPYFSFLLKGGQSGDVITIMWTDNLGRSDQQQRVLK